MLLERLRRRRHAGARNAIRDELLPFGACPDGAGDHHRVIDLLQRLDRARHLVKLDAIATQLDLIVAAAEEHQPPRLIATNPIARPVQPFPGRPERIRHEAFGGQAGLATIAPRQPGTSDIEFTDDADRHLV